MDKAVVLRVGEDYRVSGLLQGCLTYAGMPSSNTFSIVHKREVGGDYAYNLFFSADKKDINIGPLSVFVEAVSPEQITFWIKQGQD